MSDTAILLFTKAPEPGKVKTRLIPALGKQGAADIHERLLRHAIRTALSVPNTDLILSCAPDCHQPRLQTLIPDGVRCEPQSQGDLGMRMCLAAERALEQYSKVLLTGSDVPSLTVTMMAEAIRQLDDHDVVMAPAEDGGYGLLGLSVCHPALFTDMPWGTEKVAQLTRSRCQAEHLKLYELSNVWDIDRPEDLKRLQSLPDFYY